MRATQVPQMLRGVRAISTDAQVYDIVIVGGGMVGMSLAAAIGTFEFAHVAVRHHGLAGALKGASPD